MYPKENRLTKKKDFDRIWQSKKSVFLNILGIKIIKNKEKNTRFGIIISTKISKKAVIRNKIKRKIRVVITKELSKIKKGYDVIIIALPKIVGAKNNEIEEELIKIFNKLKIYL